MKYREDFERFMKLEVGINSDLERNSNRYLNFTTAIAFTSFKGGIELNSKEHWISVEDKPIPILEMVLAGNWVFDKLTNKKFFEQRVISIDEEGAVFNVDGDYDDSWNGDDYSHWQPLPSPPLDKG